LLPPVSGIDLSGWRRSVVAIVVIVVVVVVIIRDGRRRRLGQRHNGR
jgi:cytochrome c-type biogenesis protein CcmH/NrfF